MSQRPQTPELGAMLEREAWVAEIMRLWRHDVSGAEVCQKLLAFAGTRTVELGGLGD